MDFEGKIRLADQGAFCTFSRGLSNGISSKLARSWVSQTNLKP